MALTVPQQSVIRKLRADTGMEDLARDPAKTIAAADARYSANTMRPVLAALRKLYPDEPAFMAEMKARRKVWDEIDMAQSPTEREVAKFVSWDDLQALRRDRKGEMTDTEYLLICLYTMTAPARADYTPMRIVYRKPRTLADGENYLILHKTQAYFLFHSYKTAAKYGDRIIRCPRPLFRVITDYLTAHPGHVFLLENDDHTAWSDSHLGLAVRRIFKRLMQKDTGISMIRHAYLTHFHKGTKPLKELKAVSDKMMHSVVMSQTYRFITLE